MTLGEPTGAVSTLDSAPVVEARGVTKRYGATTALADAGIVIEPGHTHGLVGRNGAGKSTLVAILTGLQRADAGELRFSGEPAPAVSDRDGWRRRVACVFQKLTIIPTLSVAENLFLNRQAGAGAMCWMPTRSLCGRTNWPGISGASSGRWRRSRGRCRWAPVS